MTPTGPQLEVEGDFDLSLGAGRSARLRLRDSRLELRLPDWRSARAFRRSLRGESASAAVESLVPHVLAQELKAEVLLRGATIARLDERPAGWSARLAGTRPMRPCWLGLLRSMLPFRARAAQA